MTSQTTTETTFQVGSLTYNKRALVRLFSWLLLGDFAMSMMGVALSKLLPLQLDSMGVPAGQIGTILSLGPLATLVLSPFIGVWSDRLRTKWGRRRPFLLISTPILAIGLLLIPHISNIWFLAVVILIVQVCNVLETVLLYLYADIIPPQLLGRFMASIRVVGITGALTFQYFLLPQFGTSPVMVWTVTAIIYIVFYQLSLHMVREGSYPPPTPETSKQLVKDYVKDGFTSKYIWLLWFCMGSVALATPASYFIDIFSKKELGLDMKEIAHMNFISTLPALFLMFPGGWIMDRFGPRVIWGLFTFLIGASFLATFLFAHDAASMRWFYFATGVFSPLMMLGLMPMLYAHLPAAKFGQLTSTQSLVVHGFIFVSANVLGYLIQAQNSYRIALLYAAPFFLLTPLFVFLLSKAKSPFAHLPTALATKKQREAEEKEAALCSVN